MTAADLIKTFAIIAFVAHSGVSNAWERTVINSLYYKPIAGVHVSAMDSTGNVLAETTSGVDGRVLLPDTIVLKADIIFFESNDEYTPMSFANTVPEPVVLAPVMNKALDEIVVKATRDVYKMEGRKLIYDVSHDKLVLDRSAYDALRNTPLVIGDVYGTIAAVPGYSGIEYRMNGLRDNMLSGQSLRPALESIPANQLERIELTTRVTPSGDILVVNFITKTKIEGLLGSISSSISDSQWNSSLYLTTKIKRFSLSVNYSNIWMWNHHTYSSTEEYRYDNPELYYGLSSIASEGYKTDLNRYTVNASFDIDDSSILTCYTEIFKKADPHNNSSGKGIFKNRKGNEMLTYTKNTIDRSADSECNAIVAFERKYSRDGYLYLAYKYYGRPTDTHIEDKYYVSLKDGSESVDYAGLLYNNENQSRRRYQTHNIQAEWNRFISRRSKLILTVRGRLLSDRMRSAHHIIDAVAPSLEQETQNDTRLRQVYGLMQASFLYSGDRFEIQPTLMLQEYHNSLLNKENEEDKFKSSRFYLNPNLQFFWLISNRFNLTVAYNMHRSVPTVWQLNPFKDFNGAGMVSYGSPTLKPETGHQLNAYISWSRGVWFLRATTANRFSSNLILQNRFLDGDLLNITYANAARSAENSISFYARGRFRRFSVSAFASANYVDFKSYDRSSVGNHGWYFNTNANIEFNFGKGWYGRAAGQFNSTKIYFQGNGGKNFAYSVMINKELLNDRLNFSVRASSVIPVWYKSINEYRAEGYYSATAIRRYHASWEFSVRWNFGHLKSEVKRSKVSLSDNDLKSGD